MINEKDIKLLVEILGRIELEEKEVKLFERLKLIKEQILLQEDLNEKVFKIQDKLNELMKEE